MLVKFRKLIWVMELHDIGSVRHWFNNPYKERQFVNVCVTCIVYMQVLYLYTPPFEMECSLMWSESTVAGHCPEPDEVNTTLSQPVSNFFFWSFESHTSLASPNGSFCLPFEIKIFLSVPYSSCSLHVSLIWLYLTITLIIMSKYKIWNFTL